jgi:N-acetylgalactosamine kinase
MDLFVDGNIPPSAGLSSSSALVCCAALTTAYANKVNLPSKKDFAELCAKCERYIGTEGGGMDQAISFLGAESKALMIEFNPIRPTEVKVPQGVQFIIANSLVVENKAAASAQFNVRVAECRLSAQVIAKVKGKDWRQVRKLLTLQESLGLPLSEMVSVVDDVLHPGEYTREELCKILEITDEELQSECLNEKTKAVGSFKLHDRALHVFEEANRVCVFKDTANMARGDANIPETLGKLMDDSHKSCSQLYQCSCTELDELVAVSKSAGALGSRLTGAGWGGCTVSLVAEENVEAFLETVRADFYEKDLVRMGNLGISLFSTKPGPGAALCNLN